jgi:Concanavalin A-like lectin/glucanases superfamily
VRFALLFVIAACGRLGFGSEQVTADGTAEIILPPIDTDISTSYAMAVLEDHPTAYYRLDENAGTVAVDASGNGHHAELTTFMGGTINYADPGALAMDPDPAISLSGLGNAGPPESGANVSMPKTMTAVWSGDWTVEGWIRPQVPPGGWPDALFIWEDYMTSGFRIGWTGDMQLKFWTYEGGANTELDGTVPLSVGMWNHVVVTKQGSTVTIYLDSQTVALGAVTYVDPTNAAENCIGACHGLPAEGTYDELAIYDHALPQARITMHWAIGAGLATQ